MSRVTSEPDSLRYDPRVGDTVQLRCGGPHMTVLNAKEGKLVVGWFLEGEFRQVPGLSVEAVNLVSAPARYEGANS